MHIPFGIDVLAAKRWICGDRSWNRGSLLLMVINFFVFYYSSAAIGGGLEVGGHEFFGKEGGGTERI
jgi:hypothetical protein